MAWFAPLIATAATSALSKKSGARSTKTADAVAYQVRVSREQTRSKMQARIDKLKAGNPLSSLGLGSDNTLYYIAGAALVFFFIMFYKK